MKCFGLTGGIATGKTTLSKIFKSKGIEVIYADKLAYKIVKPGSIGLNLISKLLGKNLITRFGTLNRELLAKKIFFNNNKRYILNKIIHPLVHKTLKKEILKLKNLGIKNLIYESPLIFENNMQEKFDNVILIICSKENQIKRLIKRNGLSELEAISRINSQMSQDKKIKLANHIINTNYDFEHIKSQIDNIINKLKIKL